MASSLYQVLQSIYQEHLQSLPEYVDLFKWAKLKYCGDQKYAIQFTQKGSYYSDSLSLSRWNDHKKSGFDLSLFHPLKH